MASRFILAVLLAAGCRPASVSPAGTGDGSGYDLVIAGGRIMDGTGNPWYLADVAIRGDRIVRIAPPGAIEPSAAKTTVNASGLAVSPGFIDIQSHSWGALLFGDGRLVGKVAQGVTSEILGEATTPAPSNANIDSLYDGSDSDDRGHAERVGGYRGEHGFDAWLTGMERHGNSTNVGSYLGATTVRAYAMGRREGAPDAAALDTMRAVVRNAMRDGAFGISSALIYPPGSYAGTDELIEMAKAMAPLHGTYITHIRSEESQLLGALDEAIRIGREGGVPVVVYHLKASGQVNWHLAGPAVTKIDSARGAGQDVKATMYPYPASGNNLSSCVPAWAHADGKLLDNLGNPGLRDRIRREMADRAANAPVYCQHNPPSAYQISGFTKPEWQRFQGWRLDAIAKAMGRDWIDTIIELTVGESNRLGKITFGMSDANVAMMIGQPWVVIGSDAAGYDPDSSKALVHPRSYGSFPRVLGKYAREERLFTMEEAVRKMTWSNAQILGLRDRGMIKEGMVADIAVFDPATVIDRATFERPHQLSEGVRHVFVGGVAVWSDGKHTGARPGRALRGAGWRPR
ncbi:MAG: D-aminoacylase [Gemmatimonadetes bacterium]|nr:D-aminoacylase [Gemmatimonadota bacterium]